MQVTSPKKADSYIHRNYSGSSINNPSGFKYLILFSMLYMSIMLFNAILTNRYIGFDDLFVLGGTFTSPFLFILDDIIAEIYGYKITRYIILTGFLVQTLFVLACQLVIIAPRPSHLSYPLAYTYLLGASLLRINLSGFAAYIIANLANSYILTRWKILLKGRYFWLRSLGSSAFSEALYTLIAIFMMEISALPLQKLFKVILISYVIKVIYSLVFAWPSNILVQYVKKTTGIDVYDFPKNLTPFKYQTANKEAIS